MKTLTLLGMAGLCLFLAPAAAFADKEPVKLERAEREGVASAIGHYARARAALLEAVREFDAGLKLANPQVLIDVHEWRNDLLDRAEDLEKILDPQPRTSETGVTFQGDPRFLSEAYK
jgi:hypothetical protein